MQDELGPQTTSQETSSPSAEVQLIIDYLQDLDKRKLITLLDSIRGKWILQERLFGDDTLIGNVFDVLVNKSRFSIDLMKKMNVGSSYTDGSFELVALSILYHKNPDIWANFIVDLEKNHQLKKLVLHVDTADNLLVQARSRFRNTTNPAQEPSPKPQQTDLELFTELGYFQQDKIIPTPQAENSVVATEYDSQNNQVHFFTGVSMQSPNFNRSLFSKLVTDRDRNTSPRLNDVDTLVDSESSTFKVQVRVPHEMKKEFFELFVEWQNQQNALGNPDQASRFSEFKTSDGVNHSFVFYGSSREWAEALGDKLSEICEELQVPELSYDHDFGFTAPQTFSGNKRHPVYLSQGNSQTKRMILTVLGGSDPNLNVERYYDPDSNFAFYRDKS